MVRFKNRHLLLEFVCPSSLEPSLLVNNPGKASLSGYTENLPSHAINGSSTTSQGLEDDDDDDDVLPILPVLPFVVPHPDLSKQLRLGEDGASAVFRAVRAVILEVFGDEGWGRLASSFKVIYHSPMTTLTILRIARPHYRTLWAGLTLLRELNGHPVIPRIVAVSGTIKKLQNRAIAYHRLVTAQMLVAALAGVVEMGNGAGGFPGAKGRREEEERKLRAGWEKEEEALNALED